MLKKNTHKTSINAGFTKDHEKCGMRIPCDL
jgi:hypothetical protein